MMLVDPSIPSHWNCYVTVDDVDAVQAKTAELGATITAPAFELSGIGLYCIFMIPQGQHSPSRPGSRTTNSVTAESHLFLTYEIPVFFLY